MPPGVLASTPEGTDERYSRHGWRHVLWAPNEEEATLLDLRRPTEHRVIELIEAAVVIGLEAPAYRGWLLERVRYRLFALASLISHADLCAHDLRTLQVERDDLIVDATRVAGQTWVQAQLSPCLDVLAAPTG